MGKHNGKARNKQGEHVGALLRAAAKRRSGRGGGAAGGGAGVDLGGAGMAGANANGGGDFAQRHTTDLPPSNQIQSVLEQDDLAELMAMADLADRDFAADREESQVLVVSGPPGTGAAFQGGRELSAEERASAEREHAETLRIPRRPAWDENTTPDQLDAAERASFLEWRRRLARLEESGASGLVLTPFERNLQVWRQLWRVLERSDVVVQVVDARDPLQYASVDLAAAAAEYDPTKRTLLLLNKSDLLPLRVRKAWARYFDQMQGVSYAFWSAYASGEAHTRARSDMNLLYPGGGVAAAPARVVSARQRFHHRGVLAASPCCTQRGPPREALLEGDDDSEEEEDDEVDDARTRVLSTPELLRRLEAFARAAVEERERRDGGPGKRRRGGGGGGAFDAALMQQQEEEEEEEDDDEEEEKEGFVADDDEAVDEDEDDEHDEGTWSETSPHEDDPDATIEPPSSAAASEAASAPASPSAAPRAPRRLVVGLVGYPNVGKSSTINAIFGAKKTAVAPTPGKTKHFQTLAVSPVLTLCDCPGLVLPRVAASKADMVAAGVVPIDRLTDVRAPVGVVARRAGRRQLEAAYGLKGLRAGAGGGGEAEAEAALAMARAGGGEPPVTAARLLRALAQARGWVSGAGMPDEARAGRQVLKDYTCGKLLHCALPPPKGGSWAPMAPGDDEGAGGGAQQPQQQPSQGEEAGAAATPAAAAGSDPIPLSAADLDLLEGLSLEQQQTAPPPGRQRGSGGQQRGGGAGAAGGGNGAADGAPPRRAGHKFHHKAAKAAARKGVPAGASGYAAALAADEDGETLRTGKRGGIVRG
jgi:large subunit GTPase 1